MFCAAVPVVALYQLQFEGIPVKPFVNDKVQCC